MTAIQFVFVVSILAVVLQMSTGQEPPVTISYGQARHELLYQKSDKDRDRKTEPGTSTERYKYRRKRQTVSDHFSLLCSANWYPLVHRYDITLQWNLTGISLHWIQKFRIERKKKKQGHNFFYHLLKDLHPKPNTYTYSWTDEQRRPMKTFTDSPLTTSYLLLIRMSSFSSYPNWHVGCDVYIPSPIPSNVTNITAIASSITWLPLGAIISGIDVEWVQPTIPNTSPANLTYQMGIGLITPTKLIYLQTSNITGTAYFDHIPSATVYISDMPESNPNHVLLWLRSHYESTVDSETSQEEVVTVYSNWSNPVSLKEKPQQIIPNSANTTTHSTSETLFTTTSTISRFYTPLRSPLRSVQPLTDTAMIPIYSIASFGAVLLLVTMGTCLATIVLVLSKRKRRLRRIFIHDNVLEEQPWLLGRRVSCTNMSSVACSPVDESPCLDDWEVPIWSIGIHDKLGEGEFGEVYKGELCGEPTNRKMIIYSKNKHFLAIKLLKAHATGSEKRDFLEEIELMKRIAKGSNPHVVNMLGCVTLQEPLSLITEFVEHGDLLTYLCACRKQEEMDNYKELGSFQPGADLLSFAYQISSGMEYLASLQVVHRDLACRNILIGAGKYLKITDFGMSRAVLSDGVYVKTTKARLPLKWMAIESIVNREFTSASDVWSFGVSLWEISTLGNFPYPNIANENLLTMLMDGYRMEKPENCSTEIYLIMLQCWQADSNERPLFSELRSTFDEIICKQKSADELYMELSVEQRTIPTRPAVEQASALTTYHEITDAVSHVSVNSTDAEPYMRMVGMISETSGIPVPGDCHTRTPLNPYVKEPTKQVS